MEIKKERFSSHHFKNTKSKSLSAGSKEAIDFIKKQPGFENVKLASWKKTHRAYGEGR
jgi:hypothetical protein